MKENFVAPFSLDSLLSHISDLQLIPLGDPVASFRELIPLVDRFAVGPYCWMIADLVNASFVAAGGMIKKVTGSEIEDFKIGPKILLEIAHPEDIPPCSAFSYYLYSLKRKLPPEKRKLLLGTLYYRYRNQPDGGYGWIMSKIVDEVYDEAGNMTACLTVITDISHIKSEGVAMMTLFDTSQEENQVFYCTEVNPASKLSLPVVTRLTQREKEILYLLVQGKASKQIASELNISIKTVENHRQSLLRKTNTNSAAALVMFAAKNGLL